MIKLDAKLNSIKFVEKYISRSVERTGFQTRIYRPSISHPRQTPVNYPPISMTILIITPTIGSPSRINLLFNDVTYAYKSIANVLNELDLGHELTVNFFEHHQLLHPIPSNWPRIGLNINLTDRKNTRERDR